VNGLVTVVAASGRMRRSRVEDVTAEALAIAPVSGVGAGTLEELAAPGDPLEVHWPCPRGLVVLPVVLGERAVDGVPLWWLVPTGPAELHQRRSYVRAPVLGDWPVRVVLTWLLPVEGAAEGYLVDLSEGGLRARLSGWTAPEGASVVGRLTLAEGAAAGASGSAGVDVTEFEVLGTAVRAVDQPDSSASAGLTEVVVQLHDAGRQGDQLRALVFAWQRAARRP
jgi:hypothetical protein